ncbi:MAG: hypothetical protein CBD64_00695 [Flavobacteriaceae bacterium TMED204]|nr:MAG: hypothetical protein CBD64_00695 [Flavobacteriaceae bacterium TMED204]
MKNIIFVLLLIIISSSCNDGVDSDKVSEYELSTKNEKAIELFRSAELKVQRGDTSGAKIDYESALRIDPDFIMVLLRINETNIVKKNGYLKRAIENFEKATESEKIFLSLSTSNNAEERLALLKKLVELNPNSSDANWRLALLYRNQGDQISFVNHLDKALAINPNNWLANRTKFGIKYPGYGDPGQVKTDANFYQFPDSIKQLEQDISKMIKLDTLNAAVYRKFGDLYRTSSFLDKAKYYYLKGVEVCDYGSNSFRSELLLVTGNVFFLLGQVEESINYYSESVDIEFDPYPKMKRIFQFATVYLFDQNHKKAIEVLDNFEKGVKNFGFNDLEITQALVSINYYKAFFYANMGNKIKSYQAWDSFIRHADHVLDEIPDFDQSFITKRNASLGLNSGLNDQLHKILPNIRSRDYIELLILNGDFKKAATKMNNTDLSDRMTNSLNLLRYNLSGQHQKAANLYDKQEVNSPFGNYYRFYLAKSLLELGRLEDAKPIIERMSNSRFFGWKVGLIKKQAQELVKNL